MACAVLSLIPSDTGAQDPPPPPPPGRQADLVAEREVFRYPTVTRRNPFKALGVGSDDAPRFEQLRLMGIIYSESPGSSVAVVGTSTVSVSEDGTQVNLEEGRAWYLKVGQRVGNVRIVEIRPEQVEVEVEEFGLTERRIMQLQTRRLGGTP
jgi:hypothetical protein